MPHLCDLFVIFSPVFIVINHITSFKQGPCFFISYYLLVSLNDYVNEESKQFQIAKIQLQGDAYKSVGFKKGV